MKFVAVDDPSACRQRSSQLVSRRASGRFPVSGRPPTRDAQGKLVERKDADEKNYVADALEYDAEAKEAVGWCRLPR
jgi:hypothetical protein